MAVGRHRRPAALRSLADAGPRGSLRDDLLTALAELTENVLASPERTVDRWWGANQRSVQRAMAQLTEIRRADAFDITNLSVALRQLRNLALASDRVSDHD